MDPSDRTFSDARELAAELLYRTRSTGPFLSDLFDDYAAGSGLDARDRHLAHELAGGVVRHRRTLDCVVNAYSRRPLAKSPPALRLLVRLGAYQLVFLDRIPAHAAVDCTVEQAKRWARPRIKKHPSSIAAFTNGLLRAVAAGMREVGLDAGRADLPKSGRDRRRLIERVGSDTRVLMDRDVFASPNESPGEYLADAFSLDGWSAGRWVERFGLSQACELARAQNRRAGLTVRVNSLRSDLENVRTMLAAEGVTVRLAGSRVPMLRVLDGDALGGKAMMMGLVQPQDPWTATIALQLDVRPGQTVLDRCAAPGTKTVQLAELMQDRGCIFAVDVNEEGLDRVHSAARRMGCHIVHTLPVARMPERLIQAGRIDRVLVDAPCSNSGVLARRPEARWRLGPEALDQLVRDQRDLLMDGLNWVVPGGKLVYATCSIEPEENEQVVEYAVKRRRGDCRLLSDRLTLPSLSDDHDGGYWAVIERVR